MSRSFRKTPIRGNTTAESEKKDKITAHKKLRRRVNVALQQFDLEDESEEIYVGLEDVSNAALFEKDGKQFVRENLESLRK